MRRAGCWIAYVLVAVVVSGLWAAFIILGNMYACAYAGGTCETNWIGVGILAAAPAVMFVVGGGVAVLHARDEVWARAWRERTDSERATKGPDVGGPGVD